MFIAKAQRLGGLYKKLFLTFYSQRPFTGLISENFYHGHFVCNIVKPSLQLKTPRISYYFYTIFTLGGLLYSGFCDAQILNNLSKITLLPGKTNYHLDSNYSVSQYSLELTKKNGQIYMQSYFFNPKNGILKFDTILTDTLILSYRTMPSLFTKPFYKRPVSIIEPVLPKDPFAYDPLKDGIFNSVNNGLKTDGNISRGISVGNKQDLVVNSNLNLRLGGKIADDVNITGVISDDNNPIQPEGNTQQLQDFDKVYIMLNKDSNNLIIGDFEMKRPNSYFMNYYKKSRGIHLDFQKNKNLIKFYSNVDAAISRGRFARNVIQGIEGNQGPYRLSGVNGETFIIIISGTEVVYLDGRRLSRGESNDYVINYNTGEVIFMPSQMITKFSRIVVEFQYSDRNYQRTVFKVGAGIQKKNSSIEINYFNEQDNKNQNFQQSLDGFDSSKMLSAKQILANAGDETGSAVIPRIKTIKPFDNAKLMYRKIDSLGFKDVFVFTQDPQSDSVFFEVVFSLVGSGKGNYHQKTSTANGRVFEWVMPVAGIPQGDYEPVEILIAPKRYQMLTVGVRRKFGNTETFAEGVYSNNDANTMSKLDKRNDDGFGLATGFKNITELTKNRNKLILTNQFKTEIVNADFKFLERYRPVEFDRNWNKQLIIPSANILNTPQVLANYELGFESFNKFKVNYKSAINYRSKELSGLNNSVSAFVTLKKIRLQSSFERLNNSIFINNEVQKNSFWNYDGEVIQSFKCGKMGGGFHTEKSVFKTTSDTIRTGSYSYNSGRAFFESPDSGKFSYGAIAERRQDKLPYHGNLNSSTLADEIKWHGGYQGKKSGRITFNGSYRSLQYLDTLVVKGKAEKNALGRIEADFPLFKKTVRFNTFYQIGTGQEQKREFVYYKVADGNGVYIWKDYDSNNVQSLNEFEIASEYDRKRANFIRTYLPVQGFIKSRNIQFNQTLNLTTPQSWQRKKSIKLFLTRFSALFVYRTDRRTTSNDAALYLNPLIFNVNDNLLLSSNASLRGTLYINRNNPTWSADLNRFNSQSKNLLVNGYETRENDETTINTRVNFNRNYGAVVQLINGKRAYYSQILTTRNYTYLFYSAEPQLQFTSSNNNIGAALIGKYYKATADTLTSENLEAGFEIRLSKAAKGSFTGNFRLVNIAFNGDAASPLGYELMKGLLPGKNYTWTIVYQQRISGNIQMDVSYDGRKSENSTIIHIGRVMVRYLF